MLSPVIRLASALVYSFVLSHLSINAFAAPAPSSANQPTAVNCQKVWHLKQKHEDAGELDVYIVPAAIKVHSCRAGWYLISKAPDWKTNFFRIEDRSICTIPLERFRSTLMVNPYAQPLGKSKNDYNSGLATEDQEDPTLKKIRAGTMVGLPFDEYCGHSKNKYVIFKTAALKTDPKCAEIMARLSGIPHAVHMHDIPLGYRVVIPPGPNELDKHDWLKREKPAVAVSVGDLRSGEHMRLETISVERLNLSSREFDIPQNYRSVSDLTQVTYSKAMKTNLTEVIDQLGFTANDVMDNKHKKQDALAKPPSQSP